MTHQQINNILKYEQEIDSWFSSQLINKSGKIFYASVDIRNSGSKIAPIDVNVFPAGFNNLDEREMTVAKSAATKFIKEYYPQTTRILLITEDHSRNLFYFDNIYALCQILAEFEVTLSNFDIQAPQEFKSNNGNLLSYVPLKIVDNYLVDNKNHPFDLIILNNDLSKGIRDIFTKISNPIIPHYLLGWYNRKKSDYFDCYNKVATQFCNQFSLNPAYLTTLHETCSEIDFKNQQNFQCIANKIGSLLAKLRTQYIELGIDHEPYLFVKADRGTYGMGIMTVKQKQDMEMINKDMRKKMQTIKEGVSNTDLILQEGIPTIDQLDQNPCEPMRYLIDHQVVGEFTRVNIARDAYSNLNSKGMYFAKNNFNETSNKIYKIIARLASVALELELQSKL
ncbi:glutamate--cysteine ligase [Rickettsiales endosymbiont of Stachyamoeba lipophora]|uniref:glutamate--cysteine ligase n=1 Tax=Rickettsiales endosymbiont of Stachyamoeba lipophora TaxID=2486578 RepID=UPI000F648FFE|nr:glutamate--cysteine ligase [Rickettsiales endosymbiont of Stachyamoeba lipophora]AZL15529.1 glutamate--cysteine ligase [Rickettsiales endosymbiont of Stachyamoeba lipophora]